MTVERLSGRTDWPVVDYDADQHALIFTGRHEKPGLFQLWGGVYIIAGLWAIMAISGGPVSLLQYWFFMVARVTGASTPADNPVGWTCLALAVGLPVLYRPVWKPAIVALFGGDVWVKVDDENVTVKTTGGRRVSVPRIKNLEIGKEQHRMATAEARRQGWLARQAPVIYQDAIEVVIRYGAQRITVAEMVWRDEAKADALVLGLAAAVKRFAEATEQAKVPAQPAAPKVPSPPAEPDVYG